eukprot:gene32368-39959_t
MEILIQKVDEMAPEIFIGRTETDLLANGLQMKWYAGQWNGR